MGGNHVGSTKHFIKTSNPTDPWYDLSGMPDDHDYCLNNGSSDPDWSDNADANIWVFDSPITLVPGDIITVPNYWSFGEEASSGTVGIEAYAYTDEITSTTKYQDYPTPIEFCDNPFVTLKAENIVDTSDTAYRIGNIKTSTGDDFPADGVNCIFVTTGVTGVLSMVFKFDSTTPTDTWFFMDDQEDDSVFLPFIRWVKVWR